MATNLSDMDIDEVSLVDDGANPGAKVVIVKAKLLPCPDCKDPAMCKSKGKCMASEPDGDEAMKKAAKAASHQESNVDLEELKKALGDAEAKLTELTKALGDQADVIKAKEAEIATLKSDITKAKNPGAADEEFLKGLPEAARTEILKLRKATADAAEQIAKANEQRETEQAIAKAKTLGVGKPEDLGPLLMRVAKGKTTEADATQLETLLKSAGEVASKSPLFKSAGSAAAVEGDPEELLKAKAADIKKAKPNLTDAQAYAEALDANPVLYEACIAKKRG